MHTHDRQNRLEINLSAVTHNAGVLARAVGRGRPEGAGICAVIKQDAYGAGAVRLAKRLGPQHVDMLAVYCMREASELSDAAVGTPVLVLGPVHTVDRTEPVYRLAVANKLHLTLHDAEQLKSLEHVTSQLGVELPLHLYVDTGMGRGGVTPDEAIELAHRVTKARRLRLAGVMSHLSCASEDAERTQEQREMFDKTLAQLPLPKDGEPAITHLADTAAIFRTSALHYRMVRPGLGFFGYWHEDVASADGFAMAEEAKQLRPAVRWTSLITHRHDVPAGWAVGYGAEWVARRPSRLALVPVGYALGYPRSLTGRAAVGLTGELMSPTPGRTHRPDAPLNGEPESRLIEAPVVGRVSMDQIVVDVTDLPESHARLGAEVELISDDPSSALSLPRLARAAGVGPHALLSGISPRVERVYRSPETPSAAETKGTLKRAPA